jgi:hypothetical protein
MQNVKAAWGWQSTPSASFRILTFSLQFPRRHWSILEGL